MKSTPTSPSPAPNEIALASFIWPCRQQSRPNDRDRRHVVRASRKPERRTAANSRNGHTCHDSRLPSNVLGVDLVQAKGQRRQQDSQYDHAQPVEGLSLRGRVLGRIRHAAMIRPCAMGRLMAKIQCQPHMSRMPPRIGPTIKARPKTAPIRPSAPPRFSGGKVSPMTAAGHREDAAGAKALDGAAQAAVRQRRVRARR